MSIDALPSGEKRPDRVDSRAVRRLASITGRKALSIIRQLVARNGPAYLLVRNEIIGVAAWIRRRQRAALIGLLVLAGIDLFAGWLEAFKWALIWWAITRIPRERADRRRLAFLAVATITRTPLEVSANESSLTFSRGTKRPVRPRSHVHVRRWIAPRIHGVPIPLGTIPQRGVISYDPRWFHDHESDARRKLFEHVVNQRLHGRLAELDYKFDWQPQYCRVAFRVLPPLPTGKLPYSHQNLPWHRLPVGPTHGGPLTTVDLLRKPHAIVSGATGSGKTSVAMMWLAHLLRFEYVELAMIDPTRLDFLWARDYLDIYASSLEAMQGVLTKVRQEAERRLDAYDGIQDWRNHPLELFSPFVLIIEEMAVLVRAIERRLGKEAAGAVKDDILTLSELGRKCNIHLIVLAQQPNADIFATTEARDQFEWNVICGNPSKEHKQMLSSYGLHLPDLNMPGRVAVIEGQTSLTKCHAFWLASPTTPGVSPEDRMESLRWLPDEDAAKPAVTATVKGAAKRPAKSVEVSDHVAGQSELAGGHADGPDSPQSVPVTLTEDSHADRAAVIPMARPKRRRSS
jgi:hypothetical protein